MESRRALWVENQHLTKARSVGMPCAKPYRLLYLANVLCFTIHR